MPTEHVPQSATLPPAAGPGMWLGIETIGLSGSVALAEVTSEAYRSLWSAPLDSAARSAQTLAPALQEAFSEASIGASQIAAVAVAVGPGSFTGLRVGVVTAKTFAYAAQSAVIGVDSLEAMAELVRPGLSKPFWTALEAHRQELFVAQFTPRDSANESDGETALVITTPTRRIARSELRDLVGQEAMVAGPATLGLTEHGIKAENLIDATPDAASVIRVARQKWLGGHAESVLELSPRYHRLSAAEEKLSAG